MGGPTKHQVLGALWPTIGNTVGLTARFSGHHPIGLGQNSALFFPLIYIDRDPYKEVFVHLFD